MSPVNIAGFSQLDIFHSFLITADEQEGNFCFVLYILQHEIPCQSGCINEM